MNPEKEKISRLLSYKNLMLRFKAMGFLRVFSDNLADSMGISASLVRKDFAYFGIKGQQKGGYNIDKVLEMIQEILGFTVDQKVILIGVGRIGEALLRYEGFRDEHIDIVAGFDIDRHMTNAKADPPILHMEELEGFVRNNDIRIAILATPAEVAQSVLEDLHSSKIEGVLNFTPTELKSTSDLLVRDINIKTELTNLIYSVRQKTA